MSKYQEMKTELDSLKKQCHTHIQMAKNVREDNWALTKDYIDKFPVISRESVCVETGCVCLAFIGLIQKSMAST